MIISRDNFDLTDRNTFAMNVKCDRFIEFDSASDLCAIFANPDTETPVKVLGGGSNMLFTGNFHGTVLHCIDKSIDIRDFESDSVIVKAGAGVVMDELISLCCEKGLWGLENLSGIPGEVGASAVQNVGAYGCEAGDVISSVKAFDRNTGEFVTFTNLDCRFAYRDSMFKHANGRYVITEVHYILSSKPRPNLSYPALHDRFSMTPTSPTEIRDAILEIRDAKLPDPAKVPSAGSFFKNPVVSREIFDRVANATVGKVVPHYDVEDGIKIPAAWLIEQCGWKGRPLGLATVWHLQPLVLTNPDRKAKPDDIIALEQAIIDSVEQRFGITLTPEVEHI